MSLFPPCAVFSSNLLIRVIFQRLDYIVNVIVPGGALDSRRCFVRGRFERPDVAYTDRVAFTKTGRKKYTNHSAMST